LLAEGVAARCLVLADESKIRGAAKEHLDLLREAGGRVEPFAASLVEEADVIVDALFGTGFKGAVEGKPAGAIETINASRIPVVSADIPSGVDGDTGRVEGEAVNAKITVAMGAEKIGTAVGAGAALAGRVIVADIGIPVEPSSAFVIEGEDVRAALPRRKAEAHKRSGGAVAVLTGSSAMTGAAVLAAKGAVRMGAGYATVGGTPEVVEVVQSALPEVLAQRVAEQDHLGPQALAGFSDVIARADALVIGPGLGRGDDQLDLMEKVLAEVDCPIVIDADGLNVLSKNTHELEARALPTVLTPHPAELARLLESSAGDIQADRVSAARKAAASFGCVVLLKGFRTVIARPDGRVVVNPTGGPELATAGTGDVLAGAVGALLAAGLDPFEAAWAGAFVHGLAGSIAAGRLGVTGVLAGDVAETLPAAVVTLHSSGEEPV
jgi:ADP-dependent NAD(P)H-hydrate dehydratase / NAD(P)H-hydrate epimerase